MDTLSKARKPGGSLGAAVRSYLADDMLTYAAALAYQVLFAVFPFIIFLVSLLGFLNLADFFVWLEQQAGLLVPGQAMGVVSRVIDEVQQRNGGLLSISVLLALWSASGGVRGLMNALNRAYEVDEDRPAWKRYLLSLVYTIGIAALLLLAAGLMVVGPGLLGWAATPLGLGPAALSAWNWLRWPLAILLLIVAVSTVYAVAPASGQRFQLLTPGAVVAVLTWVAASVAFGYYLRSFANYSATYGSLGAVVILVFYFYLSSAILLFGAELNAALGRRATGRPVEDEPAASAVRERQVDQQVEAAEQADEGQDLAVLPEEAQPLPQARAHRSPQRGGFAWLGWRKA